jgi:hypothetical protein
MDHHGNSSMTDARAIMGNRRDALQIAGGGLLGALAVGWMNRLVLAAEQASAPVHKKRCILLWMDGGPSHVDTFDPKPRSPAEFRGTFEAIATAVPGIAVSEHFPLLAARMRQLALIRGMSTIEADHGRARIHMHSGYRPGLGGLTYPGLGSIVSAELGRPEVALPHFVATGRPLGKYDFLIDPGYLGPRHAGLAHYDPARPLENLAPPSADDVFRRREVALAEVESQFQRRHPSPAAASHRAVFERAARLIRSDAARAFDIENEPAASRQAYGDHDFGRSCLLARRLVEAEVPFVEVYLENWDTHEKKSADAAARLMPVVDRAMATLLDDLSERGLLKDTLVIWMGEFGRTPRINRDGGRDHYAKAWTTVLAGGGVRGGQTVGRTDATAATVVDCPVSTINFLATICRVLGIDAGREIMTPLGRPVTIVEKGAEPIAEIFQ